MLSIYLPPSLLVLTTLLSATYAQTFTSCNPLDRTDCPLDTALGRSNYTIDFESSIMTTRVWNTTAGSISYGSDGAEFTINERGDAPTVQTNFYIFFGQVEVIMRAATGQGIISSIVLESNDLDEVDWEFMGGNTTHVETNYFGKGNTTSFDRAIYYPVSTPQDTWHNYTVDWSKEKLDWYIDGNNVRTLKYSDALDGQNFPQTPCNVRLGIWAGGDKDQPKGTIEWAGGLTDYDKGPYTMYVQSVRVKDAHNATQYRYSDTSGSFESIEVMNSEKALELDGENGTSTAQSMRQRWNGLSQNTKIAILASVLGVIAICTAIFAFCCVKQRRAGKRERALDDAAFEKQRGEVLQYRQEMSRLRSERYAAMPSVSVTTYGDDGPGPTTYAGQPLFAKSATSVNTYDSGPERSLRSIGGRGGGYQRY